MHYEEGLTTTADDDNLEDSIIESSYDKFLQLSIWRCLTRFLVLLLL